MSRRQGRGIGLTTSGGQGHRVGKSLAFAYVQPAYAKPGTDMTVWILGEPRKAKVLAEPAYDAENATLKT